PEASGSWAYGLQYQGRQGTLATVGAVADSLLSKMDIEAPVYCAEIDWNLLLQLAGASSIRYKPVSKYPAVRRDLALLVNQDVSFAAIREVAEKTERQLLRSIRLFDVYAGKGIEPGKKSYAVSFLLQDPEKTLTDKRVDKVMQRLQAGFESQLGAAIR
ncbi:MAG: phenylalanine--tRNA ligase subunit beta, partial [Bacteroidota bacterium]